MSFSSKLAVQAEPGYVNGKEKTARFDAPNGITFDKEGNFYIINRSGSNNSYIRKLSPDDMLTIFCKYEYNPETSQYEEAQ
jgi:beta-xylosidase